MFSAYWLEEYRVLTLLAFSVVLKLDAFVKYQLVCE